MYGWAAWLENEAALTLRNPGSQAASFALDAVKLFELPEDVDRVELTSVYLDQRLKSVDIVRGATETISLQPFEVLVFQT